MTKSSKIGFIYDIGLILLVIFTRAATASVYLQQWDSVQFALGLHDFDIARHQPHPTGYPGYIVLGWLSRMFTGNDNDALVTVGVVSAAITAVAIHRIALKLFDTRTALLAGVLTAINPLLWYYSCVALAYMPGVAMATCAVWAAISVRGNTRWIIPILNALASIIWAPAGILAAPACLYGFAVMSKPAPKSDHPSGPGVPVEIIIYAVIAIFTVFLGYLPVIVDTGGFSAYLAEIGSESGKHVLRFGEWISDPIGEFLATTKSLAMFFNDGLGMGTWLLLILLIPVGSEKGADSKRVTALLPLVIAALGAFHWGTGLLKALGIIIFFSLVPFLRPSAIDFKSKSRERMLLWWLVPGLLLFVLVYVNLIGILTIFLPPLILLVAWAVSRASDFMAMQTVRDNKPDGDENSDEKIDEKAPVKKIPDPKVGKFVLWVMIILLVMNDLGGLAGNESGENILDLKIRDEYIGSIISAIESAPVDESRLMILGGPGELGGPGNYRHMQYYFPDSKVIWIKYILYNPVRENRMIWRSDKNEKSLPDEIFPYEIEGIDTVQLAASFDLTGIDGIIAFENEISVFDGMDIVTPLYSSRLGPDSEPICYLVDTRHASKVVFLGADFADWIMPNGEYMKAWVGEWNGSWWLE